MEYSYPKKHPLYPSSLKRLPHEYYLTDRLNNDGRVVAIKSYGIYLGVHQDIIVMGNLSSSHVTISFDLKNNSDRLTVYSTSVVEYEYHLKRIGQCVVYDLYVLHNDDGPSITKFYSSGETINAFAWDGELMTMSDYFQKTNLDEEAKTFIKLKYKEA
jgi:hypothetical protein